MSQERSTSDERKGTVQHLEDALDAAENQQAKYHIREALQLLGIE